MSFSKEAIYKDIEAKSDLLIAAGRAFFECPEPGFGECKTADMICEHLDRLGIAYERDVALTGVIARIGHGSRNIGVAADMDALPRKDGKGYIHSCGHSIQVANALALLDVLLPYAEDEDFDGQVTVYFTPAEELTNPKEREELVRQGKILAPSGKQHMITAGLFEGVDCVLSCHASADPEKTFNVNSVLTGFMTKRVIFSGQAAHSGAAPHLGRNALNGAILASQALAFLKDQFAPEEGVSIHPVIKEVSGGINIIPDHAVLETYIRALSMSSLNNASAKFDICVTKCAEALDLTAQVETMPGYLPLNQSKVLCEVTEQVMLDLVDADHIIHDPISGASGDIGDLSQILPCIQFGFSGIRGNFHTDDFIIEDEPFCYVETVKVLAGVVCSLLNK